MVEDEKSVSRVHQKILALSNINSDIAEDIETARKLLKNNSYDMVLLDILLGSAEKGRDGISLLGESLEIQPDTPVIMLTGHPTVETASEALRLGAYDYLTKPADDTTLVNTILRAVDLKRLRIKNKQIEAENLDYQHNLEQMVRKKTVELNLSENRYRNLFEQSKDAVYIVARDGAFLDFNLSFSELFGYSKDELNQITINDLFSHREDRHLTFKILERAGSFKDFLTKCRRKDDTEIDCLFTSSIIKNDAGQPSGYQGIIRDITEWNKAVRALQRQSTAIEQTADSVVITDSKGQIQYVNPAYEAITGYKKDEVINTCASLFMTSIGQKIKHANILKTIRDGSVWQGNIINEKKDGTPFREEVTVSPVRDKNNVILNYVTISRDITHKKRLESIAEASNLMKNFGYIFSGIRHEIGNPINSLKMALTVLKRNIDSYSLEKTLSFVDRSLAEVTRIEYLLKMLKNFSLYEKPKIEETNLCEFMGKFTSLAEEDFERRGIHIRFEEPEVALFAWTDPRALHHIMLNIIINAADALSKQEIPFINISLHQKVHDVVIKVADNGCGMTEEEAEQLFKPFYTTKEGGTGLGLVIVKNMLAKMGGSIGIDSTKNVGTTIHLTLPKTRTSDD